MTAINYEAGTIPQTKDPEELDAAELAGKLSYRAHPYYLWRYGERGLRFTSSDSAWLVFLVTQSDGRIIQQIDWLWSVLANRGMPGLLLERHLLFLRSCLRRCSHRPQEVYDKLTLAADYQKARRLAVQTEEQLQQIATLFTKRLPVLPPRLTYGTGELLASALADLQRGAPSAVSSLTSWLGDPDALRQAPGLVESLPDTLQSMVLCGDLDNAWRAAVMETVSEAKAA